jgi:hypothetical protein
MITTPISSRCLTDLPQQPGAKFAAGSTVETSGTDAASSSATAAGAPRPSRSSTQSPRRFLRSRGHARDVAA